MTRPMTIQTQGKVVLSALDEERAPQLTRDEIRNAASLATKSARKDNFDWHNHYIGAAGEIAAYDWLTRHAQFWGNIGKVEHVGGRFDKGVDLAIDGVSVQVKTTRAVDPWLIVDGIGQRADIAVLVRRTDINTQSYAIVGWLPMRFYQQLVVRRKPPRLSGVPAEFLFTPGMLPQYLIYRAVQGNRECEVYYYYKRCCWGETIEQKVEYRRFCLQLGWLCFVRHGRVGRRVRFGRKGPFIRTTSWMRDADYETLNPESLLRKTELVNVATGNDWTLFEHDYAQHNSDVPLRTTTGYMVKS